ncbi:TonB-dependent receptor, partial [Acinetobacter baumannii]
NKLPNTRDNIFNNPPNPFKVALLSAYAQDEYAVTPKLKITAGLRLDYSSTGNQPGVDAQLNTTNTNPATGQPLYVSANPTYTNTPF